MNEPEKLFRRRGASGWRLHIYDALWEAADEGYHCSICPGPDGPDHAGCLSSPELQQQCERRFNMSGTVQWYQWILLKRDPGSRVSPEEVDYSAAVVEKLKMTRTAMVTAKEVRNIGSHRRPIWTLGARAPRTWHSKHVVKGHFREYLHPRADAEGRKYVRRMKSGWPAEVRAELARSKPRPSQMQALLEEALDIYA